MTQPTKQFSTRNSIFEVDPEAKLVRRISGANFPLFPFTKDGVWILYTDIIGPKVYERCWIFFADFPDAPIRTSSVTAIIDGVRGQTVIV